MNREYDVFEQLPNGDVEWRGFVLGLEAAPCAASSSA